MFLNGMPKKNCVLPFGIGHSIGVIENVIVEKAERAPKKVRSFGLAKNSS